MVERTIEWWKLRFQCLHKSSGGLLFVSAITVMLHNLAVRAGMEPVAPKEGDEDKVEADENRGQLSTIGLAMTHS